MHISRVGSVFITVSIAIERYLSVCQQTSEHRFKSLLIPIAVTSAVIYNIPKFFELETVENDPVNTVIANKNYTVSSAKHEQLNNISKENEVLEELGYRGTPLRLNHWYYVLYVFWSKILFVEIIPWITVIILNFCIWRKIKEFQRTRRALLRKEDGKLSNIMINNAQSIIL